MKLARSLLASAAVLVLAACGTDPVSVDRPTGPGSHRATIVSDTTVVDGTVGSTLSTESDPCLVTVIDPTGLPIVRNVCEADGPFTGGGGT